MTQRWQKIWDAFHLVAESAPGDREKLLNRVCGDDVGMRAELRSLLAAADRTGDFLDKTGLAPMTAIEDSDEHDPFASGSTIGPYRLEEILGEGGMGVVFRARQESPIRRDVALKLIRVGLDNKEAAARFEAERQALALMDHPNIATVFDAGTTPDGRLYFVMELFAGVPITRYCDDYRLAIRDRISLVVTVCQAVQHAHRMGIIHRDLKPSNILVARIDEQAVPKVIDFGVQKATDPGAAGPALTLDRCIIGTPEYMSPEQWEARADIDTRSDVYSLGVLMYQLLVGTIPFEMKQEEGWRPFLKNLSTQDPLPPSTRLASLGVAGEEVADLRQTDRRVLRRHLRGELDWIVMKAIAKDRDERYQSAAELADDLSRFLACEPVFAGPRSTVYLLRTLARRHRVALFAAAAVFVALMAGLASTTLALRDARRARTDAEQQAAVAEQVNRFLNHDLLAAATPERTGGSEVTVRAVVDKAAEQIAQGFDGPPVVEARIRDTLGNVYFSLGEYPKATRLLESALEIRRDTLGNEAPETIGSAIELAMSYRKTARIEEAERLFREALEVAEQVLGPDHAHTKNSMLELATLYREQGKLEESENLFRRVLAQQRQLSGDADIDLAKVLNNLASVLIDQGRYADATVLFNESLEIHHNLFGQEHLRTVAVAANLAAAQQAEGRYAEALPLLRQNLRALERILGPDHDRTLLTRLNLSSTLGNLEQHEEAETTARQAYDGLRRTLGENHPLSLAAVRGLAVIIDRQGRSKEAEPLFVEAVAGARRNLPPGHWYTGVFLSQYGRCLTNLGRFEDAETALLEAFAIIEPALEPGHSQRTEAIENLMTLYETWGRHKDSQLWKNKLTSAGS